MGMQVVDGAHYLYADSFHILDGVFQHLISNTKIQWEPVNTDEFLRYMPKITVIHLTNFYQTDTKVRQASIRSNEEWREFSEGAVLPWYRNGLEWSAPNSENYTLQEYAREYSQDPQFALRQGGELLIISVYHSLLRTRLLVDGCKRAVALEIMTNSGKSIPMVRALECYGTQMHCIFPADFCNLIARRL